MLRAAPPTATERLLAPAPQGRQQAARRPSVARLQIQARLRHRAKAAATDLPSGRAAAELPPGPAQAALDAVISGGGGRQPGKQREDTWSLEDGVDASRLSADKELGRRWVLPAARARGVLQAAVCACTWLPLPPPVLRHGVARACGAERPRLCRRAADRACRHMRQLSTFTFRRWAFHRSTDRYVRHMVGGRVPAGGRADAWMWGSGRGELLCRDAALSRCMRRSPAGAAHACGACRRPTPALPPPSPPPYL